MSQMCGGEKLVWQIFFLHFILCIFYQRSFAPIGLQKTNAASGWLVKKCLSINYCDFLTQTDAVTENAQKYLAAERGFYGTLKGTVA